uniref:hypothetical protein n=1 Tax=Nonomuraea sp. CA-251285 TaxID=3240002 RepID=UPI003F49B397
MTALHAAAQAALDVLAAHTDPAAATARAGLERALGRSADHIRPAAPGWTPTVAVDFDGVLHLPPRPIRHGSLIEGDPMPGAGAGLRQLMACFAVAIHTCRPPSAAAAWIRARLDIPAVADDRQAAPRVWTKQGELLVTNFKVPALGYLDDRAIPFVGDWEQAVRLLLGLLPDPWTATDPAPQSTQETS